MKQAASFFLFFLVGIFCCGCFSLSDKKSTQPTALSPTSPRTIQDKKPSFAPASGLTASSLPDMLGGILASDNWTVYQDKQEEEFTGHVHYDNAQYIFRSDYALLQRKKNLFTARGNVYVRHNQDNQVWYELHAHQAIYNYQTGRGHALAAKKSGQIKLVYHTEQGDLIVAHASRADIDTKAKTYQLTGHAVIVHTTAQGVISTLKADRIFYRQQDQYALLQGHAYASQGAYQFQAATIEYNATEQRAYAYGDRPLAQGSTQDNTFAIIADKATAQTDSRKIHLEGKVQGWVVSEQINQSKANHKF